MPACISWGLQWGHSQRTDLQYSISNWMMAGMSPLRHMQKYICIIFACGGEWCCAPCKQFFWLDCVTHFCRSACSAAGACNQKEECAAREGHCRTGTYHRKHQMRRQRTKRTSAPRDAKCSPRVGVECLQIYIYGVSSLMLTLRSGAEVPYETFGTPGDQPNLETQRPGDRLVPA